MRFDELRLGTWVLALLTLAAPAHGDALLALHQQRYAMGTMFDIVVYHPSRAEAGRAVEAAFAEIFRLEAIMSHYRPDSELSRLNREARHRFVSVDPSLYEIIRESIDFSRRSGGKFDITIAPLLEVWKAAGAEGRRPSAEELARARRCVGFGHVDISVANAVRFRTDCVQLDLGGIGKGYAVDRALASLKSAGIRHAMINAGGSSIVAIGAPPGRSGWPVLLGTATTRSAGSLDPAILLLTGQSVSTSQQDPALAFGEIIDPAAGSPAQSGIAVSVVAPTAAMSDALSTTALLLPLAESTALLATFPDVSAVWISPAGEMLAAFRQSQLPLSRVH